MSLHEGSRVVYVGDDPAVGVGTVGRIIAQAGSHVAHVQWLSGDRHLAVDSVSHEELIPDRQAAAKQDNGDDSNLTTFAVRETYDEFGEEGVLNALSETGHLATLTSLADEALGVIGQRLREDPEFSRVLSSLDDQEADSLMVRVAVHLIQGDKEDS